MGTCLGGSLCSLLGTFNSGQSFYFFFSQFDQQAVAAGTARSTVLAPSAVRGLALAAQFTTRSSLGFFFQFKQQTVTAGTARPTRLAPVAVRGLALQFATRTEIRIFTSSRHTHHQDGRKKNGQE